MNIKVLNNDIIESFYYRIRFHPKTFGEKLRKARMDAGLMIKELAALVGVTEDMVINL